MEYRIDDLAAAAGVTTRNVRAYQERGLVQPAIRHVGRAAIYDDSHLARLRLVETLIQRGFTSAHIVDFIAGMQTGRSLPEILGVDEVCADTTSEPPDPLDIPRDLAEAFLGRSDVDLLHWLENTGMGRVHHDVVSVTQRELIDLLSELQSSGMEFRALAPVLAEITRHIDAVVAMTTMALRHCSTAQRGSPTDTATTDTGAADVANRMREIAVTALHAVIVAALDRDLHAAPLSTPPASTGP